MTPRDETNETSDDQDAEPTMTAPDDVRPDGFAEAAEKTRRDDEQSDS